MNDHPIHDLADDVHQRVRLGILASVVGLKRADFTSLKASLALSDGNLGRHLEVLERAGLVTLSRETDKGRPRTWVAITRTGKAALRRELDALRRIMDHVDAYAATEDEPSSNVSQPEPRSVR